jgi:photosystem II stability/assembly factor-like uncharacterized protein
LRYGTDLNGIYISTDNGLNWSSKNSGLPASNILTLAVNGNNILAGTNGNGVYLSTDNGSTWNESSNGLTNTSIDAMVISGNNIFTAAGGEGIYLSSNDGSNWSHLKNGTPDTYIYSLALSGNNIFAGTRTSGVYMSTDNGTDWYGANNGLNLWNVENYISLAANGNNILAGTWEGHVYLSNNNAINWKCIGDFGSARSINALTMSGNTIFAAIGQGNGSGGVWRTTDNGTNWTVLNSGLFSLNDVWDIAISGNKIFFGASYFSTDNGLTWNTFSTNGLPVSSIYAIAVNGSKVFAGTNGQGVWSRFQSETLPVELSGFTAVVKQNSIVLNWKTATESNNYGFEVERALYNDPSVTTKWETLGFIKGSGNSISTKEYSFTDITIRGNGKFSYRLKQIDNEGKINYSRETEISVNFYPQVYSLENNFPNPFNPGTVIKYSLPYESNVKLTVYNTLGIKVRELISEVQQPGLHDYKFNAAGLSSGVYLYTIEASSVDGKENYNSTKKMILMK